MSGEYASIARVVNLGTYMAILEYFNDSTAVAFI